MKSKIAIVHATHAFLKNTAMQVDLRSLAGWRILTGIAVIYDLIFYKSIVIEKYYFADILRPATAITPYYGSGFKLVERLGETGFTIFIYATLLCAVCFTLGMVGKYVKLLLFLSYTLILINSIYLISGFHFMVLVSIFWTLFLPTSAVWCVGKIEKPLVHPLAVYGLYLQITLIYLTGFLVKNGDLWLQGHAIELVVHDEYYASGLAFVLRGYPAVTTALTYGTLLWEFLIPVLILVPIKRNLKDIAACMIIVLHLGIAIIAQVGPFILIGTAFSFALLSQQFWGYFKRLNKQIIAIRLLPSSGSTGNILRTVVLLATIVVVVKGNLRIWYTDSYLSTYLQSIPGSSAMFYKQWFPSFLLYGVSDQPWIFFQMTSITDLGIYIIVEENDKGVLLINNQQISSLDAVEPVVFKEGFNHGLNHSDFIYMASLRGYPERFPTNVYHEILLEYDKEKENTKNIINKRTLYYLSKTPVINSKGSTYIYKSNHLYEWNRNTSTK